MGKISYERCVYESVDDRKLSWLLSQKITDIIHAAYNSNISHTAKGGKWIFNNCLPF